ncbi:type II toxin-antitoxin system HicB family antitoxin [Crocosphaera sp. XPORK-15E]|uniref:type II toxin-antitoxin system HicB family antitoxin n=1 Tax=Crocosphaera sp. XPORK-15E TaxID=3110247 RepID=UPI002B2015F0|nr:type II toxin-antitoxin system HicB family antitoxin [Crocosphaera sp. XPORK-15E]MEA5532551.1 type II toxin-antitoxin system HicB family antitoxin [Crocosphaera sp. XPORK-15E]
MNFYTVILRKSAGYWVSFCLENGLVGQGETSEQAIDKLKEAIESFLEIYHSEDNVYSSPIHIDELHEFLTIEDPESSETYELRKVYA